MGLLIVIVWAKWAEGLAGYKQVKGPQIPNLGPEKVIARRGAPLLSHHHGPWGRRNKTFICSIKGISLQEQSNCSERDNFKS